MQWDDDVLEEDHVLISQWDGETTNDTGKDIKELSSTVELMGFVDQSEETLVDSLSNHLSSWDKFSVELVKDVLKVVSFNRFF